MWAPFFHLPGARGFRSGLDLPRAMKLRALAREFEELRAEDDAAKNVPAVRSAMALEGFPPGPPRPPLAPLDEADERRVAEVWAEWSALGLVSAPEPATR